ncbi:hypothetical protein GN958_ATG21223, partial [Phytophthora infestans]
FKKVAEFAVAHDGDDAGTSVDFSVPRELKSVRFFLLADIKSVESGVYYRPTSNTFGALGAFVFVGNACYGLQMTLNREHGIKESKFKKQSIRTGSDSDSKRPGAAAKVNQFVASLDVIGEHGQ